MPHRLAARHHAAGAHRSDGLAGAWFEMQKHHPDVDRRARARRRSAAGGERRRQLRAYFAGEVDDFDVAARPAGHGVPARRLAEPARASSAGSTRSYGDIARELGLPSASRAVGSAVGRNPVSVIVPCHRVVGSSGALTGYAGGLDRKTLAPAHRGRARCAAGARRAPAGASLRPRDIAELIALAALWGGAFLFMRVAVPAFGPFALAFLRVFGAALLLVPLLAARGELGASAPPLAADRGRRLLQLGAALPLLRLRRADDQRRRARRSSTRRHRFSPRSSPGSGSAIA